MMEIARLSHQLVSLHARALSCASSSDTTAIEHMFHAS
jgi:hypothetical protein